MTYYIEDLTIDETAGLLIYDENNSSRYLMTIWQEEEIDGSKFFDEEPVLEVQSILENTGSLENCLDSCLDSWERLKQKLPIVKIEEKEALRLKLMDIYKLHKNCWNVLENPFLQYSYYRARHLLLFKEKNHIYLAVPGYNKKKEEPIAKSYGFYEHLQTSSYGYWYKEVELGQE
ncbi:hypothetical protein P261_01198 [Lachnospiraceae bacterium TWA4]|nr:hypothetical protein P261_01198 [Lachnospiraceae bacterium TWA4]